MRGPDPGLRSVGFYAKTSWLRPAVVRRKVVHRIATMHERLDHWELDWELGDETIWNKLCALEWQGLSLTLREREGERCHERESSEGYIRCGVFRGNVSFG